MPKIFRYDITDTFAKVSFSTYKQNGLKCYINNIIERDGFFSVDEENPTRYAMTKKVVDGTIRCFFHRLRINQETNEIKHKLRLANRFNIVFVPLDHKEYYREITTITNIKKSIC